MIYDAEPQWKSLSQLFAPLSQSPLCSYGLFDGADITDALLQWWVGVVGRCHYHNPPLHTHTHTHRKHRWAVWSHSELIFLSTTVITLPENIHFNTCPPSHLSSLYLYTSFWNHLTCVLFFRWEYSRRWDRMKHVEDEWSEEITAARVQYRLSTGIPGQTGESVTLPTVFRLSHVSRGDLSVSCCSDTIQLVRSVKQKLLPFPSKHVFQAVAF